MEQNKQKIKPPKFANLLSDSGFKAVLMSPRNKNLLKELLNLVLPEDRKIEEKAQEKLHRTQLCVSL